MPMWIVVQHANELANIASLVLQALVLVATRWSHKNCQH